MRSIFFAAVALAGVAAHSVPAGAQVNSSIAAACRTSAMLAWHTKRCESDYAVEQGTLVMNGQLLRKLAKSSKDVRKACEFIGTETNTEMEARVMELGSLTKACLEFQRITEHAMQAVRDGEK